MGVVPALVLENLTVGYCEPPVARVASLTIMPAEVVALVGPSGAGKTTMLSTIAGTLEAQGGTIAVDGVPCNARERLSRTARTLQNFPLLHWLTVRGNLELSSKIRGKPCPDPRGILTRFRAEHLIDRFPKTLSGGERCRASLAQAVVTNPRVLLLDEPFTGLDTLVKRDVARTLFDFARQERAAVLFVTHDLDDACQYAGRILVLTGGTIRAVIDTKEPGAIDRVCAAIQKGDGA